MHLVFVVIPSTSASDEFSNRVPRSRETARSRLLACNEPLNEWRTIFRKPRFSAKILNSTANSC